MFGPIPQIYGDGSSHAAHPIKKSIVHEAATSFRVSSYMPQAFVG